MHWLDPSYLPVVTGTVASFLRNPHGDVDGMLLDDGRQVHVPPHMGAAVEKRFALGDTVEARCVRPRGAEVYAAVSVTNAAGKSVLDEGPGDKHARPKKERPPTRAVEIAGRVRQPLYAPRGEVSGAVLESGEQLRLDPKANVELVPWLAAGAQVRVWGEAFRRKGTTVVDVSAIAFADDFD